MKYIVVQARNRHSSLVEQVSPFVAQIAFLFFCLLTRPPKQSSMEVLNKARDFFHHHSHKLVPRAPHVTLANDSEMPSIASDPIDIQTLKNNLGGNHILIDFSTAGFKADDRIPLNVETTTESILISEGTEDDTLQLQNAINAAPVGHRLRLQGTFTLKGSVEIRKSGLHLLGPAEIHVHGPRRTVFQVTGGGNAPKFNAAKQSRITDAYVPVGATKFSVAHPAVFKVGDQIVIQRQITDEWICATKGETCSTNEECLFLACTTIYFMQASEGHRKSILRRISVSDHQRNAA
jgi:hypothetical protein